MTRNPWRNIIMSNRWSRVPCRPALTASSKAVSSAAVRKSLARSSSGYIEALLHLAQHQQPTIG